MILKKAKNHRNIVRVLGEVLPDPKTSRQPQCSAGIVMEYCKEKSLVDFLSDHPPDKKEKLTLALDIIRGLTYLHKIKIVHRDVKPGNILIARIPLEAKLADFGCSAITGGSSTMQSSVGTECYVAPEVKKERACPAVSCC